MTADQWIALGVILTATGVALMASMAPYMAAMVALGVSYMGIGGRMKRREYDDEADGKGTT